MLDKFIIFTVSIVLMLKQKVDSNIHKNNDFRRGIDGVKRNSFLITKINELINCILFHDWLLYK